jgi:hypothetical protein
MSRKAKKKTKEERGEAKEEEGMENGRITQIKENEQGRKSEVG